MWAVGGGFLAENRSPLVFSPFASFYVWQLLAAAAAAAAARCPSSCEDEREISLSAFDASSSRRMPEIIGVILFR